MNIELAAAQPPNNRHNKILNILRKIADDVLPVSSSKIASAIVIGNEIVSIGINSMKSHPFQKKYSRNSSSIFWHSETNAIFNSLKRVHEDELRYATLYIVRSKYNSSVLNKRKRIFGLARPCTGCMSAIQRFRIPNVIYTCEGDKYAII
jgi:deoxycytidylate deaminase